jgi:hypothetical protein
MSNQICKIKVLMVGGDQTIKGDEKFIAENVNVPGC